MSKTPELTPELREELERRYKENTRISAFLVYYSNKNRDLVMSSWFRVADAYNERYEKLTYDNYAIEDFLVVNTFKEFEKE